MENRMLLNIADYRKKSQLLRTATYQDNLKLQNIKIKLLSVSDRFYLGNYGNLSSKCHELTNLGEQASYLPKKR